MVLVIGVDTFHRKKMKVFASSSFKCFSGQLISEMRSKRFISESSLEVDINLNVVHYQILCWQSLLKWL